MENNIRDIKDKNNFTFACLQAIRENIMTGNKLNYNPVCISGLSRADRYKIFFRFFNKDFNSIHKNRYISCKDIKVDEEFDFDKDLIIIENVECIIDNSLLQKKLCNIINVCLERNIQIILCSDINPENLTLDEQLKCRLTWGISLYLN